MRGWLVAVTLACGAAWAVDARACGASAGGVAGACNVTDHDEETRPNFRLGAAVAYANTRLRFGNTKVDAERSVALANFDWRPTSALALRMGAGPVLGGGLTRSETYEFESGNVSALSGSWRVVEAKGARPFALLTLDVAAILARTSGGPGADPYRALDVRVGGIAGYPMTLGQTNLAFYRIGSRIWWSHLLAYCRIDWHGSLPLPSRRRPHGGHCAASRSVRRRCSAWRARPVRGPGNFVLRFILRSVDNQ